MLQEGHWYHACSRRKVCYCLYFDASIWGACKTVPSVAPFTIFLGPVHAVTQTPENQFMHERWIHLTLSSDALSAPLDCHLFQLHDHLIASEWLLNDKE